MTLLLALTVSIGLLAVVAAWLFLGPLAVFGLQVWQLFIAWASFYNQGGKTEGLTKTIVCMSFGAIVGMLSVMLAGQLGALGSFGTPVAVGLGAASLVVAAHIGLLSTIPASVYGFASIAGLILLKGVTPLDAIAPTIGSIILGAAFGWVSETIAGKLVKA